MSVSTIFHGDAYNEQTRRLIEILDNFFYALEHGIEKQYLPDINYKWCNYIPTSDEIDNLIIDIDEYIDEQISIWGKQRGFDTNCGLVRLLPEQRLALAQQLDYELGIPAKKD